mgnify:FL=1
MRFHRRPLALLLSLALAGSLTLPAFAAETPSFADFRIDAAAWDFPQQTVSIHVYRPNQSGSLQVDDALLHSCTLNRVTGDASFYIQPNAAGVWVTVDFLTDLNGDGVYELVDSDDPDTRWTLAAQNDTPLLPAQEVQPLAEDEIYVLSARDLSRGAQVAALERSAAGGAGALDAGLDASAQPNLPLCLVNLHRADAAGEEQIQSYYLKIYDKVLTPDDLSPGAPYYDAVEFCLAKGYLSNTGSGAFSPDLLVDRAQLSQILWRMGGSLSAPAVQFDDVTADDWYRDAVSWCFQEGIMTGQSDTSFGAAATLTREQMALIFFQFAGRSLPEMESASHVLDKFSDQDKVSSWAQPGLEWAVANGLLTGYEDGTIRPNTGVTRASMAEMLYAYDRKFSPPETF